MRIRSLLITAFLVATILPSTLFGLWSYQQGVNREFAEVEDRHLLLAQNLGAALERYHTDLVGTFESISVSLLAGQTPPNLERLMTTINLECVAIIDERTGSVIAQARMNPNAPAAGLAREFIDVASQIAVPDQTSFSAVMASENGPNVLLGVRRYGDKIAIAVVGTQYFVELGKSISFGLKGHAAIVDHKGNVLAHPLPAWIAERKNISKVSAVTRMMNGETGIEQFYSPALKGDMIAGLTHVEGPGWGVMIPQPVSELYAKVYENYKALLAAIALGLVITLVFVLLFVNSFATPIEKFLGAMMHNAKKRKLARSEVVSGLIPIKEIKLFNRNYNHMVTRVSNANRKIENMAFCDDITGLPNRVKLEQLAGETLRRRRVQREGGVLILIDLDDFKQINDVHGHAVGDDFLRDCAAKLTRAAEKVAGNHRVNGETACPIVARMSGDEFVMLVCGLNDDKRLTAFLEGLRKSLASSQGAMGFISKRSASIGCARFPADGDNLDDLIKFADIAMFHAKKIGKNRYEIYNKRIGTMTAHEIRHGVEMAIKKDQLVLEYQPKIDAGSGRANGVEALVRWNHPLLGRMPPMQWIPAITHSPVIKALGQWVICRAMDDHKKWADAGLDLSVSVNVGSEHFASPDFTRWLVKTAKHKKFPAFKMEIEITEDALFSTAKDPEIVLDELHTAGFKISIDDFGTGYSNIARLSQLPVDCLKIDRSVVVDAHQNERAGMIMDCIVTMAKRLGCQTVAEGVENDAEVAFSTSCGVDTLQGFHFAESMGSDALVDWVKWQNDGAGEKVAKRSKQAA